VIRFALRNPHLVAVLSLVTVVFGVLSVLQIPSDLLPQFKTPAIQILTLYPGMPAEVMERDIMSRLERWTGQSNGIEHQEARAMPGVCIVKDFFHEGVDANTAMSQVTSLAMSDLYYLPPGTVPPMVMPFDPTASIPLCLVSVSSDTMTEKQLYDIAYYEMRNQLQAISGVIAPAVYGGVLRRIHIYVDPQKLAARGLSPMDVVRATRDANVMIPTGSAKFGTQEYMIVSNAMVKKVEDLNDVPVAIKDGRPIFVRDIGYAKDSNEIQTNIVRINGRRQVYIPIYRQPGANTLEIVDSVRERSTTILQRIRAFNPEGTEDLRLDVVMDQSVGVRASIDELLEAGAIGAGLVALIILIFLFSVRSTAIVLLSLPLSIMAAVVGLYFTGNTLNSMTLGGISLAVGILTDQSVVVLENISRHLAMGKTRTQAALDGGKEVARPVLVSTLTFIVVFLPIIFLKGIAGFLFTPLAMAVTFAMIASYVVALTLVPTACARFLKAGPARETAFDRIAAAYKRLVFGTLRLRYVVVLVSIALLLGVTQIGRGLGTELFPPTDAGQFMVLARAPTGTRIEETEKIMAAVEQELIAIVGRPDAAGALPDSEMAILITNIGVLLDWPAAYTPNAGSMDSFLLVQLKEQRDRSAMDYASEVRRRLKAKFPGVEFAVDTGGMLTAALNQGLPSPIDVQVEGSKLEVLNEIAGVLANEFAKIEGAVDVRVAQRIDFPAIEVEVDRTKAAYLGLTQRDVIENVVTATNSSISFAKSFWIDERNGNHYFIGAQYPEDGMVSFQTLEDIPITGKNSQAPAQLKNVAELKRTMLPAVINHRNITRVFDVYVNVEGRDVGGVAGEIDRLIAESPAITGVMSEYGQKGYKIIARGEVQSMRESFGQFGMGLILAVLLVYLLIVAQFRSFLDPLVILVAVPLGLVGVVLSLSLSHTAINIPVFMGSIMTVGLVVAYSLLLVDFANRLRQDGLSAGDAIAEAARLRLRPILMTSLTTSLAMIPLAIGASANAPLARAIIGGVLSAGVLSLFVVPSTYVLIAGRRRVQPLTEEIA
jgi:multidrug efflux pump subunit AcrB